MADAVIGALRVVIGADSAALDKNLKESQSSFAKFGRDMTAIAAGIGLEKIIEKAFGALTHAVKQGIQQADQFGKAAQKFGVPVEHLSALSLAASLSDVSMETLGKSLGKLSKTMVESAAKPTSEAANAFKALGVSVVDSSGKIKPTETVLSDIAGKFEGLKDGAGKTAVAMALFGRGGAELIPMLNSGKAGLKGMTDEAAQLGLVITNQTAKSAEAFNDNLTRLSKVKDGIILQVTARMLPALQNLSQVLIDAAKNSALMDNAATVLTITMQTLVTGAIVVGTVFKALGDIIGGVSSALAFFAKGEFTAAWDALKTGGTDIAASAIAAAMAIKGIWVAGAGAQIATEGIKGASTALKDFNFSAMAGKNALDQFLASQVKSQAAQQAALLTDGLAAGAKDRLRVVLQGLAIAKENDIALSDKQRAKLYEVAAAAEELGLKLKGAQLVQENKLPHEQLREQLANNEAAMRAVGATAEEIARAQERATERLGMGWQTASGLASNLMGSLSTLAGAFAKDNKAMGIASKAFAIAQAIINTQMAVTKALAFYGPTPWGFAAAGVAAAAGAASIATIAMQRFKSGADFTVPGGIGGGDKMFMPMMLEPGEHVQITPNSARAGQGGGGDTRTIIVDGLDAAKFYSGEAVRKMISAINVEVGNGSRLRAA